MLFSTFLARYYSSVDKIPIGNFTKCMSGDLSKVSKNKYYSVKKSKKKWARIFDQYIKIHGLPESYLMYMQKMTKSIECYNEVYNGKKWMIVKARIYESEAKHYLSQEGEEIGKICARISKFLGFPVRENECSVTEFYNYVGIMETS